MLARTAANPSRCKLIPLLQLQLPSLCHAPFHCPLHPRSVVACKIIYCSANDAHRVGFVVFHNLRNQPESSYPLPLSLHPRPSSVVPWPLVATSRSLPRLCLRGAHLAACCMPLAPVDQWLLIRREHVSTEFH